MFRKIRIFILFTILATVALGAWRTNSRLVEWKHSIHVGIYPIAADQSPATQGFMQRLHSDDFNEISDWIQEESRRYGKSILQPVILNLALPVSTQPPSVPSAPSLIDALVWSLKLRYWASKNDNISGPQPHIRLFILFHDPNLTPRLPHSTGIDKGQIGVIHAFASRSQKQQNAVVITHELLHTLGASDKYDLGSLQPIYPQGYAEPEREPRFPQRLAEIMAGRTPIDAMHAEIPANLAATLIGPETAREIGLLSRK